MRSPAALRKEKVLGTPQVAGGVSAVIVLGATQGRTTPMSASTERQTGQVNIHQENDQNLFAGTGVS